MFIFVHYRRSIKNTSQPTAIPFGPIKLPALRVKPVSTVQLSASHLLPIDNAKLNPLQINLCRFRVVDITIGVIQRQSFNYDFTGTRSSTWVEVREFSGLDVIAHNIRYIANVLQPDERHVNLQDKITFQVYHIIQKLDSLLVVLPIHFARIGLCLTRNTPFTVFQNPRVPSKSSTLGRCITRWNLEASTCSANSTETVYFTIVQMPMHGHIYLHKAGHKLYLGKGSVFQQRDVNDGALFYKFRRVMDELAPVEQGLSYVRDEFRFKLHVYSYRPALEHTFTLNILEIGPPAVQAFSINNPVGLNKQVAFINTGGSLVITRQLLQMNDFTFPKIQYTTTPPALMTRPTFHFLLEVHKAPLHGRVHVRTSETGCALGTHFIPIDLLDVAQLVYSNDGSSELSDEFELKISYQDTMGLFLNVTKDSLASHLEILHTMFNGHDQLSNAFIKKILIQVKPDGYSVPQLNVDIHENRMTVMVYQDPRLLQNRLYLNCPHRPRDMSCSGATFRPPNYDVALISTIVVLNVSRNRPYLIPDNDLSSCIHCLVSDGLFSFYLEFASVDVNSHLKMETEVEVTVNLNGSTNIFLPVRFTLLN